MSGDECADWIPDQPAWDYIQDLSEWKDRVVWCGWPVLANSEYLYLPHWRPKPATKSLELEAVQKVEKLCRAHFPDMPIAFHDGSLEGDMVRHVMSIYSWRPIIHKHMLDLGTIMQALAEAVKSSWGEHWARDIILMSWSQAERQDQLSLFPRARIMLVVLRDEKHWALMIVVRGRSWGVCYDGKPHEGMLTATTWVGEFLGKSWVTESKMELRTEGHSLC